MPLAFVLIFLYPSITLLTLFGSYALSAPAVWAYRKLRRRARGAPTHALATGVTAELEPNGHKPNGHEPHGHEPYGHEPGGDETCGIHQAGMKQAGMNEAGVIQEDTHE